jgi:copper type II ascorbate-dependent monooxygenase-like protein
MTSRGWIAAALAILFTAAIGIALLKHKARSSTTREGQTTAYRPWKKRKLEFNKQIAPIVYSNCAKCHYPGSAAPFALTSYREVRNHAPAIRRALDRGLMPPWKPDRGFGKFFGDRSLTDQEKGMIKQWLTEGCREGNPSKRPAPPKLPPQWPLGPPDDILQTAEPFKIPADGEDIYRCFVIPTNYAEDRWVRAADFEPGNPKVVHHALLFVDTSGKGRARDAAEPGPGFTAFGALGFEIVGQLGGFVVGTIPHALPDGVGYFLPKGADIIMQVHYHPTGKEETDRSQVGLYFCKQPVDKKLRVLEVTVPPKMLRIPPGESNCVFWAEQWMPPDVTVLQVFPHMHLIGRTIEVTATLPNGSLVPIVRISDWDFRWQNIYNLKNPLDLPAGSRMRLEARYDNSSGNPLNPNKPSKLVTFGFGTFDEMCIVWIGYTADKEFLTRNIAAPPTYPDHFLKPWALGKPSWGRK